MCKNVLWLTSIIYFGILLNIISSAREKTKIGIIGAGIGGASCAFLLRELLGTTVDIYVYEQNAEVGGRLASIKHDGVIYEIGAQFYNSDDKYIREFVKRFGYKEINVNRKDILICDKAKLKKRNLWDEIIDVRSMLRQGKFLFRSHVSFKKVYKLLNDQTKFDTVHDIIYATKTISLTTHSIDFWLKRYGLSKKGIEISKAWVMKVYGQFEGIPGLAACNPLKRHAIPFFTIQGGNYILPKKLLDESGAILLLNEKVIQIRRTQKSKSNIISTKLINGGQFAREFDYVILATPIAENLEQIEFQSFQNSILINGVFRKKFITILEGNLDKDTFTNSSRSKAKNAEDIVFFYDGYNDEHNIEFISKLKTGRRGKPNLWRVQSERPLSTVMTNSLFENMKIIKQVEWSGYPDYKSYNLSDEEKFILDENLFYINCIEWAISSVEMSIIGAKNVTRMIVNDINKLNRPQRFMYPYKYLDLRTDSSPVHYPENVLPGVKYDFKKGRSKQYY